MYMKCHLSCSDESFGLCCYFFVTCRVGKCDNKLTLFISSLPKGEKSGDKLKEVADTKGSHPKNAINFYFLNPPNFTIFLVF